MDDELLVGRYQRRLMLGAGGMGDVWLADDLDLGRQVAVKRLRFGNPAAVDAEMVERMLREARIVARLKHPAIVTLHDLLRVDGRPYLIMEYVEGESLAELVTREGAVAWPRVAQVVADIAGALAAAHRAGVLHRDVKPANVLLDLEGGAHLADFGIARGDDDAALTKVGELVGTVAYMPPEIARNDPALPASDIWSLGATFYAAVEGSAPFADSVSSVPAMLLRLTREEAPLPRRAGPATPLLTRMLAMDPSARPTAAEVATELARILAEPASPVTQLTPSPPRTTDTAPETPPPPHRPPPPYQPTPNQPTGSSGLTLEQAVLPRPPTRQRRRRWPLVAGSLVLLAGGATAGVLALQDDDAPGTRPPGGGSGSNGPGEAFEPGFTTVDVGPLPSQLTLTNDGRQSFVSNEGGNTVSVIDNATGAVDPVTVCQGPKGSRAAPDGTFVFTQCQDGRVAQIDTKTLDVYLYDSFSGDPGPLTVTPDSSRLLIPTSVGTLEIYDVATHAPVASLGIGSTPREVRVSPDGNTAYVPDPPSGVVVVVDLVAPRTVDAVTLEGRPDGVQLSADGSRAYVTVGDGVIRVFSTKSLEQVEVFRSSEPTDGRVRIQPRTGYPWVPIPDAGLIDVFSDGQRVPVKTVELDGMPGKTVEFSPDGTTAYLIDDAHLDVAVLDTTSYGETRLEEVGDHPHQLTVSPDGRWLYVVGHQGGDTSRGTVTVVPLG